MLNFVRLHSVEFAKASFAIGAICAGTVVISAVTVNGKLLSIGVAVCLAALSVTFIARTIIWIAKKYMNESIRSMKWLELSNEQFLNSGIAAQIAFLAQHLGIFAAVFGFGYLSLTMLFVFFGSHS